MTAPSDATLKEDQSAAPPDTAVSVVIVHRNRIEMLERTLSALHALKPRPDEVIVVDNASSDGVRERLRRLDHVQLITLPANVGVEAFNIGAAAARFPNLLILDDDAVPDPESWRRANATFMDEPRPDAMPFNPVHPSTGASEWPDAVHSTHRFHRMGCCNLVRTRAWREAGGYVSTYFLYRNDTDFALTLLARGATVVFDPAIRAYHDSPFTSRKSELWLRLATRNWIWMARRHGSGLWKHIGILAGVGRACMIAGPSIKRFLCVANGVIQGLSTAPPRLAAPTDGEPWRSLVSGRLRRL